MYLGNLCTSIERSCTCLKCCAYWTRQKHRSSKETSLSGLSRAVKSSASLLFGGLVLPSVEPRHPDDHSSNVEDPHKGEQGLQGTMEQLSVLTSRKDLRGSKESCLADCLTLLTTALHMVQGMCTSMNRNYNVLSTKLHAELCFRCGHTSTKKTCEGPAMAALRAKPRAS